jgi:molybdopterin/thiamine biosynthesis adenylyltransferase
MTTRHGPLSPRDDLLPPGAAVKVIGLGGVGGIVVRYLAVFLASLMRPLRLVLIDGDTFEPANASRMYFARTGNKAAVVRDDLLGHFSDAPLSIIAIPEYVVPENLERLLHDGDVVLLAVDNHPSRKALSDFCGRLRNVCLISGGNDGVGKDASGNELRGTYGNCQIFIRRDGEDASPPLTRYHPEIREPADRLPTEKGCDELVASVPQILFANMTAAAAMLNAFWLYVCGALPYSEVAFDIAEGLMRPVDLPAPAPVPVKADSRAEGCGARSAADGGAHSAE